MHEPARKQAIDDWGRTVRLCVIVLAERIPAVLALALWLAARR